MADKARLHDAYEVVGDLVLLQMVELKLRYIAANCASDGSMAIEGLPPPRQIGAHLLTRADVREQAFALKFSFSRTLTSTAPGRLPDVVDPVEAAMARSRGVVTNLRTRRRWP